MTTKEDIQKILETLFDRCSTAWEKYENCELEDDLDEYDDLLTKARDEATKKLEGLMQDVQIMQMTVDKQFYDKEIIVAQIKGAINCLTDLRSQDAIGSETYKVSQIRLYRRLQELKSDG